MHNQTESRRNFLEIPSPKFTNYPSLFLALWSIANRGPAIWTPGPGLPGTPYPDLRGWAIFGTCRLDELNRFDW